MTTKNNKEIIVKELNKLTMKWSIYRKLDMSGMYEEELRDFATSLLAKLNKLDRKNIEDYIKRNKWLFESTKWEIENAATKDYKNEVRKHTDLEWNKFIDFILSLIPEEGEVIAGGEIKELKVIDELNKPVIFEIEFDKLSYFREERLWEKLDNKKKVKIQIIIREVKDGHK